MGAIEPSQYWAAAVIGIATLGGCGGLFWWACMHGAFRNVERPASRMLELDRHTGVRR